MIHVFLRPLTPVLRDHLSSLIIHVELPTRVGGGLHSRDQRQLPVLPQNRETF